MAVEVKTGSEYTLGQNLRWAGWKLIHPVSYAGLVHADHSRRIRSTTDPDGKPWPTGFREGHNRYWREFQKELHVGKPVGAGKGVARR